MLFFFKYFLVKYFKYLFENGGCGYVERGGIDAGCERDHVYSYWG